MLEQSAGLNFFLKTPKNKSVVRFIYLRVTVDGIPRETSTKRKWNINRWDQKTERATGSKEDARTVNFFLDSLVVKINQFKIELINNGSGLSSQKIIDFVLGKTLSREMLCQEFKIHNDEMFALVAKKEYAIGTYEIFERTRLNVEEFIQYKYRRNDLAFRELNFDFIKGYEFYLKTVKSCNNNTTLKYIGNVKKIVYRAIAREIISKDPFQLFKSKRTKPNKKPLTKEELRILELKQFTTDRLDTIRDVFVFQCYTGLAYIDVYQLRKGDIKKGDDGGLWIMSARQKSKSNTDIPLLPKALEIIEKYKNDPVCIARNTVLPVKSNQKMNEYLKEIAILCGINSGLNTHKARRTFGSTVTLNNGVPIHLVKEMLGHSSVKQTEEYAITEYGAVGKAMQQLRMKLEFASNDKVSCNEDIDEEIKKLERRIELLKSQSGLSLD